MADKSINEQLCMRLQRWDKIFQGKHEMVNPDESVWYELERFFPYFVLVECDRGTMTKEGTFFPSPAITGRIGFVDRNQAVHGVEPKVDTWYHVEPYNKTAIENHIAELQPNKIESEGVLVWMVPLYEGNRARNMEEVNAYLHNLMFWESQIVSEEAGPMMQRIVWLMDKVYDQREEMDMAIREMQENGIVRLQEGTHLLHSVKTACTNYHIMLDDAKHQIDEALRATNYHQKSLEEKEMVLLSVDALYKQMSSINSTIERNRMVMENIANMMDRISDENRKLEQIQHDWAQNMANLLTKLEELKKHD